MLFRGKKEFSPELQDISLKPAAKGEKVKKAALLPPFGGGKRRFSARRRRGARRFGYFANQGKTVAAGMEKAAGRPAPFKTGCPAAACFPDSFRVRAAIFRFRARAAIFCFRAYAPGDPFPRSGDCAPLIRSNPRSPRTLPACPLRRRASSCPESGYG